MKKHLPGLLCMAAVLAGLLTLFARAGAEQTHRSYLRGYPDGSIRPEAPVTRAALACVLLRLAETELPQGARVSFTDVPGTSWAYPSVTRLAGLGLLPFGTDGRFCPDRGINWRELSGVLDAIAASETGRAVYPALSLAWDSKKTAAAAPDDAAAAAIVSRAVGTTGAAGSG